MKPPRLVRWSAAVLCAGVLMIGAAGCSHAGTTELATYGTDPGESTSTTLPGADPVIVAEVQARMRAESLACSGSADDVPGSTTPPPRDLATGTVAVGGVDGDTCMVGRADIIVVSDTPDIPAYVAVHPLAGGTQVIGWWADGYGWVTPAEHDDPAFDLDAHKLAFAQLTAGTGEPGG